MVTSNNSPKRMFPDDLTDEEKEMLDKATDDIADILADICFIKDKFQMQEFRINYDDVILIILDKADAQLYEEKENETE